MIWKNGPGLTRSLAFDSEYKYFGTVVNSHSKIFILTLSKASDRVSPVHFFISIVLNMLLHVWACGCKAPVSRANRFIGFWLNITFFVCNQQYLFLFGNDMCLLAPGQKGQPIYRFLVKYHLFLFANGSTQTAVNNTKLATWHTAYHTRSIKISNCI